jgi:hypothetical protein
MTELLIFYFKNNLCKTKWNVDLTKRRRCRSMEGMTSASFANKAPYRERCCLSVGMLDYFTSSYVRGDGSAESGGWKSRTGMNGRIASDCLFFNPVTEMDGGLRPLLRIRRRVKDSFACIGWLNLSGT